MAKRRKSKSITQARRDAQRTNQLYENIALRKAKAQPIILLARSSRSLQLIEDRRYWTPNPDKAQGRRSPAYVTVKKSLLGTVPIGLQFHNPLNIAICIRRKTRIRVLHALRKTGKTGQRKPKRNPHSNLFCGAK